MDDGESSNMEFATANGVRSRTRSGSAGSTASGHKRSFSGSLLSKLSFLRMSQATQAESTQHHFDMLPNDDGQDPQPRDGGLTIRSGGKSMSSALQQQQRRTRRRKGSLRKTALLGTGLESREKRAIAAKSTTVRHQDIPRSTRDITAPGDGFDDDGEESQPSWFRTTPKALRSSAARRRQSIPQHRLLGDETGTDDEDLVSFPATNGTATDAASALHMPTPSSSSDSYYPLQRDAAYRPVHRTKSSPLATHSASSPDIIAWDYSETEWWGWIILIVTWLVFVVGIGSCFEVWSWAWDVGETPYAPPELEDDPTLPIVGYYPALIILTAVMAWVWVVVAWVGMKYFKHANISGDDT